MRKSGNVKVLKTGKGPVLWFTDQRTGFVLMGISLDRELSTGQQNLI